MKRPGCGLLTGIIFSIMVSFTDAYGWSFSQIHTHSKGKGIPIILVHGNRSEAQPRAIWGTFERYIDNNNSKFENFDVYIWYHETDKAIGFNGSAGNARDLSDFISHLIWMKPNYNSKTKFIFVAHSRGGLVCRSYMNYDYDDDGKMEGEKILGLITLGTPHHGSPAAVPDWAAFDFNEKHFGPVIFNSMYGIDKVFDPFRLGDLNLAWDNMDQAKPSGTMKIEYDAEISAGGEMHFSPRDMNKPSIAQFQDTTRFYKDQWDSENFKGKYGTLFELNQKESYKHKIIAFAAYDNNFADNLTIDDIVGGSFGLDHDTLEALTTILGTFDVDGVTREGIKFYANDGMVPLQSALFLDISDGSTFSSNIGLVSIDEPLIESHRQVKKHYIYSGTIRDHLHLLDTGEQEYWDAILSEILCFTRKAMPWIPFLLLDD